MPILIPVLAGDEKKRQGLLDVLGVLHYEGVPAKHLSDLVSLLGQMMPRAVLVVEEDLEVPGELVLKEIQRIAPLLPVIFCLKERNASRAVEYMRLGAFECVAPPWTEESLQACLHKAVRFDGTTLEPFSAPPPSRKFYWGLILFLATLLSFGLGAGVWRWWAQRISTQPVEQNKEWDLPYTHPSGIVWDGKFFWIGDWFSQSVYVHSPKGFEVKQVVHFPSDVPVALTFAEGALWMATASGFVQKHLMDNQIKVLSRFKVPGTIGLCYDGLYLWSLDGVRKVLIKHILDEQLTSVQSYDYPGLSPISLACDGKTLWSLDGGKILKLDIDRPSSILSSQILPVYQSEKWKASGLTWDGTQFWTVAEGQGRDSGKREKTVGKVFRHPMEKNEIKGLRD
ncbi:MAG: hypothetical protein HY399_09040 [Elusimicrobia bacterium]|nr:hypothetical protein [Elusimicrobiota bacterium]